MTEQEQIKAVAELEKQVPPPDTGDDSLMNVRRLRARIVELELENIELRNKPRSANGDLMEQHANERKAANDKIRRVAANPAPQNP